MNKSPSFTSQDSNSTKKLNKMEFRDSPVTKDEFASNPDFLMKIGFTNVPKAEAEPNQTENSPIKKPFKKAAKEIILNPPNCISNIMINCPLNEK